MQHSKKIQSMVMLAISVILSISIFSCNFFGLNGSKSILSVVAGYQRTMILKTDGTLWATGSNADGELGDGTTDSHSTPVQIMNNVKAVAVGEAHTLILKKDGALWATGSNFNG